MITFYSTFQKSLDVTEIMWLFQFRPSNTSIMTAAICIDIQMSNCMIPFSNPFSSGHVKPLLGRFSELEALLSNMNIKPGSIDAVLLDAGCSSMQMDQAERGFALSKDGPLDMRMDAER